MNDEENEYYENFKRNIGMKEKLCEIVKNFDMLKNITLEDDYMFKFFEVLSIVINEFFLLDNYRRAQLMDIIAKFLLNVKYYELIIPINECVQFLISIDEHDYDFLENITIKFDNEILGMTLSIKDINKFNKLNFKKFITKRKDIMIIYIDKNQIFIIPNKVKIDSIVQRKILSSISLNKLLYEEYMTELNILQETNKFSENLKELENSIIHHIKYTKRNTKSFKDSFKKIKELILNNNELSEKIIDILQFGSLTQFCHNIKSDLEFSIQINNDEDYAKFYNKLKYIFITNPDYTNIEIISTKRTQLLKLYDLSHHINIEILINNKLPIINSKLIYCYGMVDKRFIILNNLIRDWSKINCQNGNFNRQLSSYCYTIMLIFFLQKGLEKPVLPNLQCKSNSKNIVQIKDYEGKLKKYLIDFDHQEHNNNLQQNAFFVEKNSMSTAELFIKFFEFYLFIFDKNQFCIDISYDFIIPRELSINYLNFYNNMDQHNYCIIDPFDNEINPSSYFNKKKKFEELKNQMFKTLLFMVKTGQIFDNDN